MEAGHGPGPYGRRLARGARLVRGGRKKRISKCFVGSTSGYRRVGLMAWRVLGHLHAGRQAWRERKNTYILTPPVGAGKLTHMSLQVV